METYSWVTIPGCSLTTYIEHNVGASYGAFPPKIAQQIKCSLEEAEGIFNAYHNEMYPQITDYRENYVLPTAKANGRIHMGLGCYMKTDNADKDIRTITNGTIQFWSILTLLTINKLHQDIDEAGLQDDIQCISTIYDSIYFLVKEDATIIKWLNDRLITYMLTPFMEGQVVDNGAEAEIGRDWASLHAIKNNASIEDINEVLKELK